jgi:hypothetical protein
VIDKVYFEILYICIGSEAKPQDLMNKRSCNFMKLKMGLDQVQEATFKVLEHSIELLLRFRKLFCSNLGVFEGARLACLRDSHADYVMLYDAPSLACGACSANFVSDFNSQSELHLQNI